MHNQKVSVIFLMDCATFLRLTSSRSRVLHYKTSSTHPAEDLQVTAKEIASLLSFPTFDLILYSLDHKAPRSLSL